MSNPLLGVRAPIPFGQVRAEHVEPAVEELLRLSQSRLNAIAALEGPRTYDNTLRALQDSTEELDVAMAVVHHLESVATTPELRAAYNAVQPAVSEFYSRLPLDSGLWRALKEYAATADAAALNPTRKRYLTKTMDFFRRCGAELDETGKKRLSEIDVELATRTTRFAENVLDSTNRFEMVFEDASRLAGLPESALAAARQSASDKGRSGYRFTLQAPSYIPVLTYLDDRSIREQFYRAYNTRASSSELDNRANVLRILELRREKARLLGFADFSDFVLVESMAQTGARAQEFLDDLRDRTRAAFARENAELLEFRKQIEGPEAPPLAPWDVAYYAEKLRRARFDFDEEDLRPFFPLEPVVRGMFEIARRLFGVTVVERPGWPTWDQHVTTYAIQDEDGTTLGMFYADWYPRENKRPGAWMGALLTGRPLGDRFEPHVGVICGNLTPPVDGKPSLLTHREVETIFHEFGHLLHQCLSRVEVRSLAGTNVAGDFVELPSQIMENWCWERGALDLFARHWQTGETIAADLFEKMKRARTFRSANAHMRQLGFGYLDLALHREYDPATHGDILQYARAISQPFSAAELPPDWAMVNSFTHLFSDPVGYAAGYYSYKWAEVLDADAFSRFRSEGIFSRAVGMEFRTRILERGDSEDPAELYRGFMGRDPDPSALLERLGLQ